MQNSQRLKSVIFPSRTNLIWENAVLQLPDGISIKGKMIRDANGDERELENEVIGNDIIMKDTGGQPLPVGKYTFILTQYRISPYAPIFPQIKAKIDIIPEE